MSNLPLEHQQYHHECSYCGCPFWVLYLQYEDGRTILYKECANDECPVYEEEDPDITDEERIEYYTSIWGKFDITGQGCDQEDLVACRSDDELDENGIN